MAELIIAEIIYTNANGSASGVDSIAVGDIKFSYDDLYRLAQMARALLDKPEPEVKVVNGIEIPEHTHPAQIQLILDAIRMGMEAKGHER